MTILLGIPQPEGRGRKAASNGSLSLWERVRVRGKRYGLRKNSLYNIYKCAALHEKLGAPCWAPVSGL